MNFLYIDTEYSSFYSPDKKKSGELLQLAIVPVVDGVKGIPFNEKCRPLTAIWNSHAEKVHKITKQVAYQQQSPEDLAVKLLAYISLFDVSFTLAGWNCSGDKSYIERLIADYKMTNEWYRRTRYEWRDVKDRAIARKLQFPVTNYKLETVAKFFQIPLDAHDALSDADVTRQVDERLSTVSLADAKIQMEIKQLTAVDKKDKYLDRKYFQVGHGTVYISEHATSNPEAMKIIIDELWDLFVEK